MRFSCAFEPFSFTNVGYLLQVARARMSANVCVESHLRELLELGFEATVVKDATASTILQRPNIAAARC